MGPSSSVHEEFLPTAGATTVTLSQTPNWILILSRAGVVQSAVGGNYSLSGSTITFSDALNGSERIIVDYASTGYTPVPPLDGAGINDNSITSAKIQDGTIVAADIANATITNIKLASDTARANLLTNGGFEIWQRGNGPFSTAGLPTADQWASGAQVVNGTIAITKETATVSAGSAASAKVVFTFGGGMYYVRQMPKTSDGQQIRGRTFTFAVDVYCSAASTVNVRAATDGTAAPDVRSSRNVQVNVWERLSISVTVPVNATFVVADIELNASCTVYLDNAMLVVGSVPADYAPLHPADDLARCLRYYELLGAGAAGDLIVGGIASVGSQAGWLSMNFKTEKAVTPTVTIVGTWATTNAAAPSLVGISSRGVRIQTLSAGAGTFYALNSNAGTYVSLEANP